MDKLDHGSSGKLEAWRIQVMGRTQGVGFRRFVYYLARETNVKGYVKNNLDGVYIHGEGKSEDLELFYEKIMKEYPPLAKIFHLEKKNTELIYAKDFSIVQSEEEGDGNPIVPVDVNVCNDCLSELMDKSNRRYRYPFINCINCGPRYTIIKRLPYDRKNTTMSEFSLCPTCKKEFKDPMNRRYRVQPNSCPNCGPKLTCWNDKKEIIAEKEKALEVAVEAIKKGKVVAIKGIGGFHLACDATNESAVKRLREKKMRPSKPLAVMAKNMDCIKSVAICNEREEKELLSLQSPIVLLMKRKDDETIAPSVHPNYETIGMFLPYTPLHHLLMEHFSYLVMTSGNLSGEPAFYDEEELFSRGMHIVDYILGHNRKIVRPLDDSVVEIRDGSRHFYRRGRGFVPDPIDVNVDVDGVFALGAALKNTFAFGRGKQLFIGPHNGNLENVYSINEARKTFADFAKLMNIDARCLAIDKHPNYPQRDWIGETNIPIVSVWHHHAHFVSCIADNDLPLEDQYIGVILDGTGYGMDGKIWGFEWLIGNARQFKRITHAQYQPLPGGDMAVREPWRQAAAWMMNHLGNEGKDLARSIFPEKEDEMLILETMLDRNLNIQEAGTCGRLFDIVSAMTNCCVEATYEGEAAIVLSEQIRNSMYETVEPYSYSFQEDKVWRTFITNQLLTEILYDVVNGVPTEKIVLRFHETIVTAIVEECLRIARKTNIEKVIFSGGSMHNHFFQHELHKRLMNENLHAFFHRNVPCNDSGISFGQALIAAYSRKK